MPAPLLSSKKCAACQQWSVWQQSLNDRCEHCGELLDPQAAQNARQREEVANQKATPGLQLIEIHPDDGAFTQFFKRMIRGGQLAFAAILAFIVWFVTLAAG
jgi:predicted amidophosphoribosyltransferase